VFIYTREAHPGENVPHHDSYQHKPARRRDQLLGLGSEHGPRHGLHTDVNAVAGRVPLGLSAR